MRMTRAITERHSLSVSPRFTFVSRSIQGTLVDQDILHLLLNKMNFSYYVAFMNLIITLSHTRIYHDTLFLKKLAKI